MPRPKTESKVADNQRLKVLVDFWNHSKVTRLWDDAVPKLGQITARKNLSSRTNGRDVAVEELFSPLNVR
jgi:hypothetical protein